MIAILAFAIVATQPAEPGRDWQEVGESDAGSLLFYDRASIRLDRATMVARFDYRLVRAESYRIARVELRCTERVARVVETRTYNAAGALLGSDEVPSGWQPIPPESSFETAADEACGRAARPS